MAYLPKLSPKVGGGLPGMPERSAGVPVRGEVMYPRGEYDFTVPLGVTSICVVCLGSGAGGYVSANGLKVAAGGGGGALAYANNIAVTAGEILQVVVAAGGAGSASYSQINGAGSSSFVNRGADTLCSAGGADQPTFANLDTNGGGVVIVGEGGAGGAGRTTVGLAQTHAQAGGGAGGYIDYPNLGE